MFLTEHLGVISPAAKRIFHQNKRLILPLLILVCLALPDLRTITITALSDAFFKSVCLLLRPYLFTTTRLIIYPN